MDEQCADHLDSAREGLERFHWGSLCLQVPGGSVNNLKLVTTGGLTRFAQAGLVLA